MIDDTATRPDPADPAELRQAPLPQAHEQAGRVEWLFRDALRRRQVHPLMELLRRYRDQEGA
jgi:hypothetical protein